MNSTQSTLVRVPHLRARPYRALRWAYSLTLLALLAITTQHATAQGCTQCLDSTRATPPAVQTAYRHAILLLIGFATTLFLVGLSFLRRHR